MRKPEAPPLMLAAGDEAWVRVRIVTALAIGYRVKVKGLTPGLTNYFCVERADVERAER